MIHMLDQVASGQSLRSCALAHGPTRRSGGVSSVLARSGAFLAAVLLAACSGEVTPDERDIATEGGNAAGENSSGSAVKPGESPDSPVTDEDETATDSSSGAGHGSASDTTSADTADPTAPGQEAFDPAGTTRVARLTHLQYDNTVSELLYLEVTPSLEFPPDPTFGGYNNNANQLRVADRLGRDYRRSAETLAQAAVDEPSAYSQLVGCDPTEPSCVSEFVASFGLRAYRRPLTGAEQELYLGLFEQGPALVASADPFKDGVQLVIEAMLQSPKFLYRTELSSAPSNAGSSTIELSDYELAQRLSYTLWNTMPDEALLESAAAGELSTGNLPQIVSRMVDDPRTRKPMRDFHFQWLNLSRYADLQRDADAFPLFSSSLPLQEEALRFIEHIGFEEEKGYASLLSAPKTFVNSELAALYGLSGEFGDELQLVELDPDERGGLLTQIGFLASNAYSSETSPIHRGVFVNRTILCKNIPDPPSNLDIGEEAIDNPRTTREAVEQQTSPSACSGCHVLINPPGFAFENFNPVGQIRDNDRGNAIDTTGELPIDDQRVAFSNAKELISALAQSQEGRTCFARNLLRYAYGRAETAADEPFIEELATQMSSDDFSIKDALTELAQAAEFVTRTPNQD